MARSRVELFEQIRRDRRAGLSIRELAEKHRVHRGRSGRRWPARSRRRTAGLTAWVRPKARPEARAAKLATDT